MNQILDPVLRKDKFEIWRKKTNDIISLVNNISSNVKTTISDTPPTTAYNGDLWWDSSTGKLKIYYDDGDSVQWLDAFTGSSLAGTSTVISENPPINPSVGDFWWDSTVGKLKIYYFDGDSCQWIDAFISSQTTGQAKVSISENPPLNPFVGDLWWDDSTGKLKIYYNDGDSVQWIDAFVYHNNSIVSITDVLPASANPGELIWDSTTDRLKIYYDDGSGIQWVDAFVYHNNTTVNISDSTPQDATSGELFWNSSTQELKIYYGDSSGEWYNIVQIPEQEEQKIFSFSEIADSDRDALDVLEYDTSLSHNFKHSLPQDDWEINFTNLQLTSGQKTKISVIVEQGQDGYIPTEIKINDNFIQVRWNKDTVLDSAENPIPSDDSIDRIEYEIYCIDPNINNYIVLGKIEKF